MPTRERKSDSAASKLKHAVHEGALSYSHVSEAPLTSSATGRKEEYSRQRGFFEEPVFTRTNDDRWRYHVSLNESQCRPTPSTRTSKKSIYSGRLDHSVSYRHRSKPQEDPEDIMVTYSRHSSKPMGSLERDMSLPTRRPTSTLRYAAFGSTRQLAKFCEKERARFWTDNSIKWEKPLKWTAQPVPRRLLGLNVVFAVVLSFLSRLWSALVLFCRRRTGLGKLDNVMISAGTMTYAPKTLSPLAGSGNSTLTREYPMRYSLTREYPMRDKVFKKSSSYGPSNPQGNSSSISALDQDVIDYLADRLSCPSLSALDQVVLD